MKSYVNWNNLASQGIVRGWILPEKGGCDPSDIVVLINGQKLTYDQIKPKNFQKNSDSFQVNFCFDLSPYNLKNGDQIKLAWKDTGEILGTCKFVAASSQSSDDHIYLFIHIPKTAGTSFRTGLEQQFILLKLSMIMALNLQSQVQSLNLQFTGNLPVPYSLRTMLMRKKSKS